MAYCCFLFSSRKKLTQTNSLHGNIHSFSGKTGKTLFAREIRFFVALSLFFTISVINGFSQKVERVVSLAPSITENIYLLGAQDKLVGCTSYCKRAIADDVTQVGSVININVEKILALQPDVVLAVQLTKAQDIETLKKLGIRVELFSTPKSFDEICGQTREIGVLLGVENIAEQMFEKFNNQVDSLKGVCEDILPGLKMFFQIGADPVFTVLPNTYMNDFILFCGAENIADSMKHGTITRESVLVKNPDIIIVATMGGFGEKEKKIWSSYKGLNAAKNNRIYLVDSETSCSPTPNNFVKALSDIVQFVTTQ